MNVKINDTLYENVEWTGNTLIIKDQNMTLSEAEEAFSVGDDVSLIQVYDGDYETQRYYNRGITSMRINQWEGSPRQIEIEFSVSTINRSVEDDLQESIDDDASAIMELGLILSELEEEKKRWNSMAGVIDNHANLLNNILRQLNEITGERGTIILLNEELQRIKTGIQRLAGYDPQADAPEEDPFFVPGSAEAEELTAAMEAAAAAEAENNEEPVEGEGEVE